MNEIVPAPGGAPGDDEGVLDPQVAAWFDANPMYQTPLEELVPELLELARSSAPPTPAEGLRGVYDDDIDGVPVRVYRQEAEPTGVVVYIHGGGYCIGSVALMDNVAKAIARSTGANVLSVEYRLAPEHPYPAGLDDCDTVTRWVLANAVELGGSPETVAVAGESAGGNLSAAVALRRRDAGGPQVAAQVLIYPGVGGTQDFPSRAEFSGLIISEKAGDAYWTAYSGDRDISRDPYAAPLHAPSLAGLPPALVILGGCDMLRDEGRAYARRLEAEGVEVDEVCIAGQPHGFVNFDLPAAAVAHERIGAFVREQFARGAGA